MVYYKDDEDDKIYYINWDSDDCNTTDWDINTDFGTFTLKVHWNNDKEIIDVKDLKFEYEENAENK